MGVKKKKMVKEVKKRWITIVILSAIASRFGQMNANLHQVRIPKFIPPLTPKVWTKFCMQCQSVTCSDGELGTPTQCLQDTVACIYGTTNAGKKRDTVAHWMICHRF